MFQLSDNVRSILIGAVLAAIGAVLAFLGDAASGGEFGAYSAFVAAVVSVLANVVRKYAPVKGEPASDGDDDGPGVIRLPSAVVVLAVLLFIATDATAGPLGLFGRRTAPCVGCSPCPQPSGRCYPAGECGRAGCGVVAPVPQSFPLPMPGPGVVGVVYPSCVPVQVPTPVVSQPASVPVAVSPVAVSPVVSSPPGPLAYPLRSYPGCPGGRCPLPQR